MIEQSTLNSVGRRKIYTDEKNINSGNVIQVLQKAMIDHGVNASDETFLMNYEAGHQPLVRKKTYRSEINIECVDNVAAEICDFKKSFVWGNPITFVQRGQNDSGEKDEVEAIALLNEQYELAGLKGKTQLLADYVETVGVGAVLIDVNTDYDDDAYFKMVPLDPRFAFVVYSNYHIDHRPMMGVSYRVTDSGNRYFTVFTKDRRYEISEEQRITNGEKNYEWNEVERSGEQNPLKMIPIIEYERDVDRTGCFEKQISEMNNLNVLLSDFTNDVDQNTQAIWLAVDIEFPVDPETGKVIKPKSNEWVCAQSSEQGTPQVKPLAVEYDYEGMRQQILSRRQLILQKCYVPQRNKNSGGSTGIAMSDATGWSAAQNDAEREQNIIDTAKMQELKAVLRAIHLSNDIDKNSPLLDLKAKDVIPKIQRQKTYEMTVKANALATLLSHGIYGKHCIDAVNMFSDPNQVWADSKPLIDKYQDKLFSMEKSTSGNIGEGGEGEKAPNSERTMSDYSDQRGNSPSIDGDHTIGSGLGR